MRWQRRRLLQAAMGFPLSSWAQVDRTLQPAPRPPSETHPTSGSLLTAPRRALVIGNSSYAVSPLKNPANDARAIAEELKRQGFEVTVGIDLKRAEILELIGSYSSAVARTKPVGLFYFAGHGLQLAWRNYLVPVDAAIKAPADIQAQCVDVNALIGGIGKAANPMNIVILDACRDDPFGHSEHKGLSQLDAPPATLLAYATSPGNVASDGDGANGLYTEHLLREMKVPGAKVEDVFKRVRLAVRRRSNGRQIPWESTSLEEDFWFIPPKDLTRLAEQDAERLYKEELALWERAQAAQEPAPIEEYLRRYPSGRFAELAQLHLDRVLAAQGEHRIEAVTSPQNPYTQGSAAANTAYRVGDSYTYNASDLYSRQRTQTYTEVVTQVSDTQVIFDGGKFVTDLLGNTLRWRDGRQAPASQLMPREYTLGKRWSTRFTATHPQTGAYRTEVNLRIVGRERVTVPAGTFEAWRIESSGDAHGGFNHVFVAGTVWLAPERCRRAVARNSVRRVGQRILHAERVELAAFKES